MKSRIFLVVATLFVIAGTTLAWRYADSHRDGPATRQTAQEKGKPLYWVSPMNPDYKSDKPGKSPMGMDLVPVYADSTSGADVNISASVVNSLNVRTAKVSEGALPHQIEAVGYVDYDQDSMIAIHTRAEGWLEKLGVKSAGDRVRAGQILFELFSPKLATAEREYLNALDSPSRALLEASGERLHSLGFTPAQIKALRQTRQVNDRVARRAERDRVIVSLGVREGAFVTPATEIMKLADLSTVWIITEVDERDAGLVRAGQPASAHFDAFPGERWQGRVDYVYPDLDPTTRTVRLRLRFPNTDGRLQPNMFAHVRIEAPVGAPTTYIPSLALIRSGHGARVVVALGKGRFDVCPVEAGYESGDQVQILKGLNPGQTVVTSAQFLIDSEANLDAAALRLDADRPGCKPPAMSSDKPMKMDTASREASR